MTRKLLVGVWVILCLVVIGAVASSAFEGRWKDDGNGGCVFDPNDDGPDQCSPATPQAPTGRFKDDGNGGCVFDPNDSGPDQCQASAPAVATSTSPVAATASKQEK